MLLRKLARTNLTSGVLSHSTIFVDFRFCVRLVVVLWNEHRSQDRAVDQPETLVFLMNEIEVDKLDRVAVAQVLAPHDIQ